MNMHYDGIVQLDVLNLVDSTEHLFVFFLEFAKPFGSTNVSPANANMVLNFLKLEPPHFSLKGVNIKARQIII